MLKTEWKYPFVKKIYITKEACTRKRATLRDNFLPIYKIGQFCLPNISSSHFLMNYLPTYLYVTLIYMLLKLFCFVFSPADLPFIIGGEGS